MRSIGECELECIKSQKFSCRAFTFRLGGGSRGEVIDNCQLSDWPVRDMDKIRHLVPDQAFNIYERASYGHGCELQPINDPKHQKRKKMIVDILFYHSLKISVSLVYSVLLGLRNFCKAADCGHQEGGLRADRIGVQERVRAVEREYLLQVLLLQLRVN